MKMLIALLIMAVVTLLAFAQRDSIPDYGSISGFVRDANTGLLILYAHVIAQGLSLGDAYTDSTGAYQITELEPGGYVVRASASGYYPWAQCIDILYIQ